MKNAAAWLCFIVVHNHPTGSAEPLIPDSSTSRRRARVGNALLVRVLDSIVVARDTCVSLAECRILGQPTLATLG